MKICSAKESSPALQQATPGGEVNSVSCEPTVRKGASDAGSTGTVGRFLVFVVEPLALRGDSSGRDRSLSAPTGFHRAGLPRRTPWQTVTGHVVAEVEAIPRRRFPGPVPQAAERPGQAPQDRAGDDRQGRRIEDGATVSVQRADQPVSRRRIPRDDSQVDPVSSSEAGRGHAVEAGHQPAQGPSPLDAG